MPRFRRRKEWLLPSNQGGQSVRRRRFARAEMFQVFDLRIDTREMLKQVRDRSSNAVPQHLRGRLGAQVDDELGAFHRRFEG